MTYFPKMVRGLRVAFMGLGITLLLAACQPLPHPFQAVHHPPAPGDLLAPGPDTGLTIAPLAGAPPAVTRRLPAQIASALLKHGIPASSDSVQGSYLVQGIASTAPASLGMRRITLRWTLIGPRGLESGSTRETTTLPDAEWQQGYGPALAEMARRAADAIAELAQKGQGGMAPDTAEDAAPPALGPKRSQTRFLIERIDGAPGDGNKALAEAIGAALGLNGAAIARPPAPAAYRLSAHVETAPAGTDEIVSIAWTLRTGAGLVLGTVNQHNHVPRGRLDHAWGNIAYLAALGAAPGLMQLVHGAPPGS